MKCLDHGLEPCAVPRCQVLALCATEVPAPDALGSLRSFTRRWGYDLGTRLTEEGVTTHHPHLIAEQVCARLAAWMRWPGPCSWCGDTSGMGVMDCGVPDREPDTGCLWVHPLDDLLPYRKRIRALASMCPMCGGSGWHPVYGPVQHELLADGDYQPTPEGLAFRSLHLPCDHDGTDWATVLVFLDWLADDGWTLQDVHEWRPPAIGA